MSTYYRRNKWNEEIEVEYGTCGSCVYYNFQDERNTNKCKKYDRYYYKEEEACKKYYEAVESTSSGCFLTTAACEFMGKSDDCRELTLMREFRDTVLLNSICGKVLVDDYYKLAPEILKAIETNSNKNKILNYIYDEICKIVKLLEEKKFDSAISEYVLLVYKTEQLATNCK